MLNEPLNPIVILVEAGHDNIFWCNDKVLILFDQTVQMIIVALIFRVPIDLRH